LSKPLLKIKKPFPAKGIDQSKDKNIIFGKVGAILNTEPSKLGVAKV